MSKMEELKSKLHKKAWEVKHDASWKLQRTSEWIRNNRDVIIAAIPIAAAAVSGTTKIVSKAIARGNLKREQQLRDRYIYDRSLGAYWELKRAPSQAEMLSISKRRKNGESFGEILSSMKLVK